MIVKILYRMNKLPMFSFVKLLYFQLWFHYEIDLLTSAYKNTGVDF